MPPEGKPSTDSALDASSDEFRQEDRLDELAINTIRTLTIDAVQKANSGHPGTPMGLAPVVYTLWQRFLRFDPEDPIWPNRDRFVLSNGHASMLLYAVLYLAGVKAVDAKYERIGEPAVTLDDIKRFRELGSKCPGHPEYHLTSGVEATTGPLGQGCGMSVGMAIAGRWLARHFNRPGFTLFDYDVYAICGDGDMMEGVSSEAASLAGHLELGNLCWIYDSNRVTIEGHTSLAFSDDVAARFLAYGWNVRRVGDANDAERLAQAIETFKRTDDVPTLIIVESHIGYGAPHKHDTSAVHGEPLGEPEIRLTKRSYGWPEDAKFLVPDGVIERFRDGVGKRGAQYRADWEALFKAYKAKYPDLADQVERMQRRELPDGWDKDLKGFAADPKGIASRDASGAVLNMIAPRYPWLIGGSADLCAVDQDTSDLQRRGRSGSRDAARPQYALRHTRAGDGRNSERPRAVQGPRLWFDLSHLLRLHEAADPAERVDGSTRHLRVQPRLHRPRRRWADASAGRTADRAAQHPWPDHDPPCRRQRSA